MRQHSSSSENGIKDITRAVLSLISIGGVLAFHLFNKPQPTKPSLSENTSHGNTIIQAKFSENPYALAIAKRMQEQQNGKEESYTPTLSPVGGCFGY